MADDQYIWVQAGPATPKGKVAIWERHPAHPVTDEFPDGGEVFVAEGQKPKQVALTPEVSLRLREDRLVRAAPDGKAAPSPKPARPLEDLGATPAAEAPAKTQDAAPKTQETPAKSAPAGGSA